MVEQKVCCLLFSLILACPVGSASAAGAVTKMSIKVDLQCAKCYKKIKKVLCSFPEIRDQTYDEKKNTVTITVVCCSPEKIKDKICCKGGDAVLGVEIIPDKPEQETEKEEKKPEKKNKKKEPEKPNETGVIPVNEPPKENPAPPPTGLPRPNPPKPSEPPFHLVGVCCCLPCYRGYGPCCRGYSLLPQMCSDGCGRPAYECPGGNRGYYVSRCNCYFSEENANGCTSM